MPGAEGRTDAERFAGELPNLLALIGQFHMGTLMIDKMGSMKFTTQNDLYQ